MEFAELRPADEQGIEAMSRMATEIVREHYDPIVGKAQNDYMLARFQTPSAIREQLARGHRYFFVREEGRQLGFLAFYLKKDVLYLSKFYLYQAERGKGYSRGMRDFVVRAARSAGLGAVELNVNVLNDAVFAYEKLGFRAVRKEKTDIGNGFYMDDFVFRFELRPDRGDRTALAEE